MRTLISIFLLIMMPLMLSSETQHRFKVAVRIAGDNETLTNLMTSHLKRELRALGDVDIVRYADDWEYRVSVIYLETKTRVGSEVEYLSVAVGIDVRMPNALLAIKDRLPVVVYADLNSLNVYFWHEENLQKLCISLIGSFNDMYLDFHR